MPGETTLRLHLAAFDLQTLGARPDLVVKIREDIFRGRMTRGFQPVVVRSAPAHRHQDDRVGLADSEIHPLLKVCLLASHQLRVRNDFGDEHW
jgi:hypothetical protein